MRINTKEIKKQLASTLKAKFNDFSVTYGGYSLNVKIKALLPKSKVESMVKGLEKIDRCHATGEILSGGNTFVFVDYDNEKVQIPETVKNRLDEIIESDYYAESVPRFRVLEGISETLEREMLLGDGFTSVDIRNLLGATIRNQMPKMSQYLEGFKI